MRILITQQPIGERAARIIQERVAACPTLRSCFATGSTVVDLYKHLVNLYQQGQIDFSGMKAFHLDEYLGLPPEDPNSYQFFLRTRLFNHVNIKPENLCFLDGISPDTASSCRHYQTALTATGGLDLLLCGVGRNGHIAFNEPGTSFSSRVRQVELAPITRQANARFFDNDISRVPTHALTLGIADILDAREIICLAQGESKAAALAHLASAPTIAVPLTALLHHPNALLIADPTAASLLPPHIPNVEIIYENLSH